MHDDHTDVGRILGGTLQTLLDRGWEFPILSVAVGVNGSVYAGRYNQTPKGTEFEELAEHFEEGRLDVPINIMFVRGDGEAALVRIRDADSDPEFVN